MWSTDLVIAPFCLIIYYKQQAISNLSPIHTILPGPGVLPDHLPPQSCGVLTETSEFVRSPPRVAPVGCERFGEVMRYRRGSPKAIPMILHFGTR